MIVHNGRLFALGVASLLAACGGELPGAASVASGPAQAMMRTTGPSPPGPSSVNPVVAVHRRAVSLDGQSIAADLEVNAQASDVRLLRAELERRISASPPDTVCSFRIDPDAPLEIVDRAFEAAAPPCRERLRLAEGDGWLDLGVVMLHAAPLPPAEQPKRLLIAWISTHEARVTWTRYANPPVNGRSVVADSETRAIPRPTSMESAWPELARVIGEECGSRGGACHLRVNYSLHPGATFRDLAVVFAAAKMRGATYADGRPTLSVTFDSSMLLKVRGQSVGAPPVGGTPATAPSSSGG